MTRQPATAPGFRSAALARLYEPVGRLRPLGVTDACRAGVGSTEGRLVRCLRFMHAQDAATARGGRTRRRRIHPGARHAAPGTRLSWRAGSEERLVARLRVPPDGPEIALRLAATRAIESVSTMRWGDVGQDGFGSVPFAGRSVPSGASAA